MNTIGHCNNYLELHTMCKHLQTYKIDIIALQEINLDLLHHGVRNNIKNVFKEYFSQIHMTFSTVGIKAETQAKPGGTILVINGNLASNIIHTHTDNLGRWCNVIIQLQQQRISVFSIYNTTKTSITTAGPTTIFFQQWKLIQMNKTIAPKPREQMIEDLHHYISKTKTQEIYFAS